MPRFTALLFLLISVAPPLAAPFVPPLRAQTPPAGPDIWVAELRRGAAQGRLAVGSPRNLTRRPGYDNQPWFLPDGSALLYVAEQAGQTDVYRIPFTGGRPVQITRTPEWREYSPTLSADGRTLTVVRWDPPVERGALWRYRADGTPLAVVPGSVPQVGYYSDAGEGTLALFINDSVQSFVLADTRVGRSMKVGERLGGSAPQRIPGQPAVSILAQDSLGAWWISRFDVRPQHRASRLVRAVPGSVHYVWTARGTVLMARGATLYEWDPARGSEWRPVHTFTDPGLRTVTRLALSPRGDRIAMVAEARSSAAVLLREGLEAGKLAGALASLRTLRAGDSTSLDAAPGPVQTVGEELLRAGRAPEAVEVFRLVVEFAPDAYAAHARLGEALAAAGDRMGARASLQRALELNPRRSASDRRAYDATRAALDGLERPVTP